MALKKKSRYEIKFAFLPNTRDTLKRNVVIGGRFESVTVW